MCIRDRNYKSNNINKRIKKIIQLIIKIIRKDINIVVGNASILKKVKNHVYVLYHFLKGELKLVIKDVKLVHAKDAPFRIIFTEDKIHSTTHRNIHKIIEKIVISKEKDQGLDKKEIIKIIKINTRKKNLIQLMDAAKIV